MRAGAGARRGASGFRARLPHSQPPPLHPAPTFSPSPRAEDLKNSEWNDWREYLESQFPQDVARLKVRPLRALCPLRARRARRRRATPARVICCALPARS